MKKIPFIVGNWKMNLTLEEGVGFVRSLKNRLCDRIDIKCGISPSFVFLKDICDTLRGSHIIVAAQNIHSERKGAYTGEVSAPMVKEVGCTHVLIGHSERRHIFGETDSFINAKLKMALSVGLKPIFCIGEKLQERENGQTESVIEKQVKDGLQDINRDYMKEITIAYEPVWAIGTGKTALPEQANDAHSFIRNLISKGYGKDTAEGLYIQYGGSVKPENTAELMAQPEIDGLLVGGASNELESFLQIIENASER